MPGVSICERNPRIVSLPKSFSSADIHLVFEYHEIVKILQLSNVKTFDIVFDDAQFIKVIKMHVTL